VTQFGEQGSKGRKRLSRLDLTTGSIQLWAWLGDCHRPFDFVTDPGFFDVERTSRERQPAG